MAKILIVDDSKTSRRFLRNMLENDRMFTLFPVLKERSKNLPVVFQEAKTANARNRKGPHGKTTPSCA